MQSHFGAWLASRAVVEDKDLPQSLFALVDSSSDFASTCPILKGDEYYESALQKGDGSTNKGALRSGRAPYSRRRVRPNIEVWLRSNLTDENQSAESADHARIFPEPPHAHSNGPIVEDDCLSPIPRTFFHAQRARRHTESSARSPGLRLINGGGRPEVQAAHSSARGVERSRLRSQRLAWTSQAPCTWMFDQRAYFDWRRLQNHSLPKNHVPRRCRSSS